MPNEFKRDSLPEPGSNSNGQAKKLFVVPGADEPEAARHGVERRKKPRINTSRPAELALGNVIVPVRIVNVSGGGCGVEILEGEIPPHLVEGAIGVLNVPMLDPADGMQLLPVLLRNKRRGDSKIGLGFEFPRLLSRHHRVLINMVGEMNARRLF